MIVDLVCKAENETVVATIETDGALDAKTIVQGRTVVDRARSPNVILIMDGVQLTCRRCHDPLYFRASDGELFAAMPGSVSAKP